MKQQNILSWANFWRLNRVVAIATMGPLGIPLAYLQERVLRSPWQFFAYLTQTKTSVFFLSLSFLSVLLLAVIAPALGQFMGVKKVVALGLLMAVIGFSGTYISYKYNKGDFSKWRGQKVAKKVKKKVAKKDLLGTIKVIKKERNKNLKK